MTTPDEEISNKVLEKLSEKQMWSTSTTIKITSWLKEGNISTNDLIFLIENQRPNNNEGAK